MNETSTTAMLVGTREMFAAQPNTVTTTVPRDEIEAALTSEPPAELILEVQRTGQGIADADEHTVNVAWSRTDLETLLAAPDTGAITFFFDPTELEQVLDESEVEGHGVREAVVVLSIAAAAAAAGASSAAYAEPGGPVGSLVQVVGHDEATLAARGIDPGTVAAVQDEATLAARGIDPGTVVSHDEATLAGRGIDPGTVAAVQDEATLAARGIEPGTVAAVHDEATLAARGIDSGSSPVAVDTASGFDLPSVDSNTVAGIAGGLAGAGLLIAAAAFAIRRREPGPA